MGIIRGGPPFELILKLQAAYQINTFIETGTYLGQTIAIASQLFERAITIEYSEVLYQRAIAEYQALQNVQFLYGDTREKLAEMLPSLTETTLFWLDAHWSGELTYGQSEQCPLCEELELLTRASCDRFILIDDARLFLSPPPPPHNIEQWPNISKILEILNSFASPTYTVIVEDVIISVPLYAKPLLVEYCQDVNARIWSEYAQQQQLNVETKISQSNNEPNPKRPTVTFLTLGERGRFGNQIFQYAFLKIYAKLNNLNVETPDWIGRSLFAANDPFIQKQLPSVFERNPQESAKWLSDKSEFYNVDFWGHFIINTRSYAQHKDYFRSLFQPIPTIKRSLDHAFAQLRNQGKTVIGLHLRRGDFVSDRQTFFRAPTQWYKNWLAGLWDTLERPVLFIASDRIEEVLEDFAEYNPIATIQLQIEMPGAEFYPDFYFLTQCDLVAISNSTFSFTACLLNENGTIFARPNLKTEQLIPFDPWNSEPVLHRVQKIYAIVFPDWQQSDENLIFDLVQVMRTLIVHPQKERVLLIIDATDADLEYVELILSGAAFELLMQDSLDINEAPEFFVMGESHPLNWEYIRSILNARLLIETENQQTITMRKMQNVPTYTLDTFTTQIF